MCQLGYYKNYKCILFYTCVERFHIFLGFNSGTKQAILPGWVKKEEKGLQV